jgi:uncharacterized membrane protein YqjE
MSHDKQYTRRPAPPWSELASRLIEHAKEIVRNEVRLARVEASEKLRQARTAIVLLAVATLLAFVGLIQVADAATTALIAPWSFAPYWAALAVGGTLLLVAALLALKARANLAPENLKPKRTLRQLGVHGTRKDTGNG